MRILKMLPTLLAALALCAFACACSAPAQSSSSSANQKNVKGTLLFEFLEENAPEMATSLKDFEVSQVTELTCYKDNYPEIVTDDPKVIQAVYNSLSTTVVIGEYTSDVFVTDQMQSVSFKMADGTNLAFGFDFGNLMLNGKLYECTFDMTPYGAAAFVLDIR